MRCRGTCATVAAAALMFGSVVALPATATPVLTISGNGPTFADFTVTTTTRFDYGNAVIRGDGRYAGVAIWTATREKSYGGVVVVPDLDNPARPATIALTDKQALVRPDDLGVPVVALAPGRYRAYLLADRQAEVRIPLHAGDSVTVTTTKTFRQTVATTKVPITSADITVSARIPMTFRPAAMYYVIGRLWTTLGTKMTLTTCFARRAATCTKGEYVQVVNPPDSLAGPGYSQSQVGVRGALIGRTMRDARTEARFTSVHSGMLALGVLTYDLA